MPAFTDRTGEVRMMNCGMKATIVRYHSNKDMDVKLEDGSLKRHVRYINFKRGQIGQCSRESVFKEIRTGETGVMANGMVAMVVDYRNANDMDVRFEDGFIRKNISYRDFRRGTVYNGNVPDARYLRYKNTRVGETRVMNCGKTATIIEYRGYEDIDIRFENGVIREYVSYREFKRGHISLVADSNISSLRVGETRLMNCGMFATVIGYISSKDMDVRFENGFIRMNVSYNNFKEGAIALDGNKVVKPVYILNGMQYYICSYKDEKCIGTLEELKQKFTEK